MRRRDVLKSMGSIGTVTALATMSASGKTEGHTDNEIRYRGTRIFECDPNWSHISYTEKFRSEELREKIGRDVVTIDEGRIDRRDLPKRYRDRTSPFTIEFEDVAYLASIDEFAEREVKTKQQVLSTAESTISSIESVPLYSYKSTSHEVSERTGPISIVWDTFRDADNIQYEMQHLDVWSGKCWCSALPSSDRYVLLDNGNTPAQHAGFAKGTGKVGAQWHVRLWDLPDGRVVGQPHYDVWDHEHLNHDPDYKFDTAREKATDSYTSNVGDGNYSVESDYLYNGSGYECDDSADGWANLITRN